MTATNQITIKGITFTLKQTLRAFSKFEEITNKPFSDMNTSISDLMHFYFSILTANNRTTFNYSYDEFIDLLDDEPSIIDGFTNFLSSEAKDLAEPTKKKKDKENSVRIIEIFGLVIYNSNISPFYFWDEMTIQELNAIVQQHVQSYREGWEKLRWSVYATGGYKSPQGVCTFSWEDNIETKQEYTTEQLIEKQEQLLALSKQNFKSASIEQLIK